MPLKKASTAARPRTAGTLGGMSSASSVYRAAIDEASLRLAAASHSASLRAYTRARLDCTLVAAGCAVALPAVSARPRVSISRFFMTSSFSRDDPEHFFCRAQGAVEPEWPAQAIRARAGPRLAEPLAVHLHPPLRVDEDVAIAVLGLAA